MKKLLFLVLFTFIFFSIYFSTSRSDNLFADDILRIDPTSEFQRYPDIYDENIVWMDKRGGETEIYIYNIDSGVSNPVYPGGNKQFLPAIFDENVVWSEFVTDSGDPVSQIFYYNLLTPDIEPSRIDPTAFNQSSVDIYEDKIIWSDFRLGSENIQIYLYDLSTEDSISIYPTSSNQILPRIYENKIVWADNIDNITTDIYKEQIYMYDIETSAVTRIDPTDSSQTCPAIYGDKVVYSDNRNGGTYQIYIYDITSGVSSRLSPTLNDQFVGNIYGNKVVCYENDQVYVCDITTGGPPLRVDPTSYPQLYPDIYEDSIVWEDERDLDDDKQQVYLKILPLTINPSIIDSIFARFESIIKRPLFISEAMKSKLTENVISFINNTIGIFNSFTDNDIKPIVGFPESDANPINISKIRETDILGEQKLVETKIGEEPSEEAAETIPAEEEPAVEKEEAAEEKREKRPMTSPHVEIKIYEGPTYVEDEMICYYRIEARVRGEPEPELEWSRDDSHGAWGQEIAQVNLESPSDTCTLTCKTTNPAGEDIDTIDIEWECPRLEMTPQTAERVFQEWTVTLHPSDIGYLVWPSGVNTQTLIVAIDSISNTAVQGFFAFDLSSLSGKKINSATLRLEANKVYGGGNLAVGRIRIGPKNYLPLDPQDFFMPVETDPYFFDFTLPGDWDYVTELSSTEFKKALQNAIGGRSSKLQCYFTSMNTGETDSDYQIDGIEYTRDTISLILEVSDQ